MYIYIYIYTYIHRNLTGIPSSSVSCWSHSQNIWLPALRSLSLISLSMLVMMRARTRFHCEQITTSNTNTKFSIHCQFCDFTGLKQIWIANRARTDQCAHRPRPCRQPCCSGTHTCWTGVESLGFCFHIRMSFAGQILIGHWSTRNSTFLFHVVFVCFMVIWLVSFIEVWLVSFM
jgi:hypothetical protein